MDKKNNQHNQPADQTQQNEIETFDRSKLNNPAVAGLLAWLIPGLGHYYQGRIQKAILFFVCIMGIYVYGCYLGSGSKVGVARVVYFESKPTFPFVERLPFICQIGVGGPTMPALFQAMRVHDGKEPLFGGFMAPPRKPTSKIDQFSRTKSPTLHLLHQDLHRYFELGTVYTMVAGLLNILVIFDAISGPVIMRPRPKDDDEEDDDEDEENGSDDEVKYKVSEIKDNT